MDRMLTADEMCRIDPKHIEALRASLDSITSRYPVAQVDSDELVELSVALVRALPEELLLRIHRFRDRGSLHDALLIRGLPVDDANLGPTPPSATSPRTVRAHLRALLLLGLMGLFGEPFTFSNLYDGRLVQDIVPAPGAESAQTSEGSDSLLDWHVEDAFSDDRCDYLGLLCLRGDPTASTMFSSTRGLSLADPLRRVLRQSRFVAQPDIAHGSDPKPVAVPVLSGDEADLEIRFDPLYMRPRSGCDDEARHALARLSVALGESAVSHVLEPGDLLVIDNRRVVHARTAFRPRFDGTDRWLMRVMVCASLRQHRRRGARRAIHLSAS